MIDGFVLIDKEIETTSNDVVRQVKKKLNVNKVGHSGTLDPDVTGLVLIAINNATKLLPYVTKDSNKTYECILKLGIHTDTYDISGKILEEKEVPVLDIDKVKEVLNSFVKTYDQYPPIYSAKRVNGKRLYEYAHDNEEVEIKPSTITINSIDFIEIDNDEIHFSCNVSKGTYIRSLCVDIAKELNTIGTMKYLRRTFTDSFDVKDAVKINDLTESDVIDLDSYIKNEFDCYEVYGPILEMIKNGSRLNVKEDYNYPCGYIDKDTKKVVAVYEKYKDKTKPFIMIKE